MGHKARTHARTHTHTRTHSLPPSRPHLSWTARARRQRFISSLDSSDLAYALLSLEISESRMDMRAPPASPSPFSTAPAAADDDDENDAAVALSGLPSLAFPPRKDRDDPFRFEKVLRRLPFRGGSGGAFPGEKAASRMLPLGLLRLHERESERERGGLG